MMKDMEAGVPDVEQLVHRFIDQELDGEERVRFVLRLGRDDDARQRLIELEQLALEVGRLPRAPVPDGFVARVLARTGEQAAPRTSGWRRLADQLWTPRVLHWNLATAAAVVCLVLVTIGSIFAGRPWRTPAVDPGGAAVLAPPAASSTVFVRLVVVEPGASTVQAAGDFTGWNPARTPLERMSNGAWTVTIPLEPGRYEYMFVIDGEQWIGDPFAVEQTDDGFGSRNAVLDVRPPTESAL